MKVVIDTSVIIDTLRGGKQWEKFIKSDRSELEAYIPTVVIVELFSGTSTKEERMKKKIEEILVYYQKIDLTENIAKIAGKLYRDNKMPISLGDYVIAATALEIGAEIVTLNRKHFGKIPGVRIYDPDA